MRRRFTDLEAKYIKSERKFLITYRGQAENIFIVLRFGTLAHTFNLVVSLLSKALYLRLCFHMSKRLIYEKFKIEKKCH